MDGRGRCLDNVFIERLWRSLKYEAVYLHELSDGIEARRVIGGWIAYYNGLRPHSALDGLTPAEVYRGAEHHVPTDQLQADDWSCPGFMDGLFLGNLRRLFGRRSRS